MLTHEQLMALRQTPLGDKPNRLEYAFDLAGKKRTEASEALGIRKSAMSKLIHGNYQSLDVERARQLAAYFGCTIEDLFPPKSAVA